MRYARALNLKPDALSASTANGPEPCDNSRNAPSNAGSSATIFGTPSAGAKSGVAVITGSVSDESTFSFSIYKIFSARLGLATC